MAVPMRPRPALTRTYHLWHGHFRLFCRYCAVSLGSCGHLPQNVMTRAIPAPSLCPACERERKVEAMMRGANHDDDD